MGRLAAAGSIGLVLGASAAGCQGQKQKRYVDPAGWSLTYPSAMYLEHSAAELRISVDEVTIATFPPRRAVRSHSSLGGGWLRVDPPRDQHGAFPADGVAFRIFRREGGPAPNVELPETRLPLRLSSFHKSDVYSRLRPRPLERTIVAAGRNYLALAWIGLAAPRELRAQLARVVSSLSFPRLRPGQTVGYGFEVLQPASRYRIGSFRRVRVLGQPFYLVHAPRGFYAVGWRWQSLAGGYKSRCRLQVDRRRKQFFCANFNARWDRLGGVLTRPRGAARGDPLNIAVAKVGWDGHVLLSPGTARFAEARLARQFWPGWHPRAASSAAE